MKTYKVKDVTNDNEIIKDGIQYVRVSDIIEISKNGRDWITVDEGTHYWNRLNHLIEK